MCKKELSSKKKVEYLEEYKNLSLRYQGKTQLTFDTIESTQKILIKMKIHSIDLENDLRKNL